MFDFLLNIFLMAGVPFLLNIYITNKTRKSEDRIHRPKTKVDRIVSISLIVVFLFEISSLFLFHPPSMFRLLNVPTNAPNWQFQNRYREYLVDTYGQNFASFDPKNIRPSQLQDNIEEIRNFAYLFNDLKNPEKRSTYLKYGEVAYTQCTWCETDGDYLLFSFSRTSLQYIYMLFFLGAVTSTTRKDIWRSWSVIIILSTVLVEIFMYLTPQDGNLLESSLFEKVQQVRAIIFAGLTLLVWLFDKSDEKTKAEMIQEIIIRNENMINRSQAHELNIVTVLLDSTLRKKYIDYYKRKEIDKSVIFSSPEYNDVRMQVISKYNLDKMLEECYALPEKIINNFEDMVQNKRSNSTTTTTGNNNTSGNKNRQGKTSTSSSTKEESTEAGEANANGTAATSPSPSPSMSSKEYNKNK